MKSFFLLSFFSLQLSSLAYAQMPPFAIVKSIAIDGSGCQAGSANAVMTSDLNYLSVLYDNFSAEIGLGTINPNGRAIEKNCTINVIIQIPAGWNFQFESIDYNGFASVPNKATLAYQLITAEVYGGRGASFQQNLLNGPKTGNFTTRLSTGANGQSGGGSGIGGKLGSFLDALNGFKNAANKVSSAGADLFACSNQIQETKLKIKSIIGVRNLLADIAKPTVKIIVDSTDASFKQQIKLKWKKCN